VTWLVAAVVARHSAGSPNDVVDEHEEVVATSRLPTGPGQVEAVVVVLSQLEKVGRRGGLDEMRVAWVTN